MTEPIAPFPSELSPWTVRLAYWYIGKRTAEAGRAPRRQQPYLSYAADHLVIYPPMTPECLASFAD